MGLVVESRASASKTSAVVGLLVPTEASLVGRLRAVRMQGIGQGQGVPWSLNSAKYPGKEQQWPLLL